MFCGLLYTKYSLLCFTNPLTTLKMIWVLVVSKRGNSHFASNSTFKKSCCAVEKRSDGKEMNRDRHFVYEKMDLVFL